jgi:hypothetical protein
LDALAWSANSQRLAYTQTTSDTSGMVSVISTAGDNSLIANSGRVLDARWLDGESFVYLTQDVSGWKLWFHSPGSGESLLGSGSETDAQFDLR